VPVDRVLLVVLLVASAALLGWTGPAAVRAWQIYAGTGRRRQRDATQRAPARPQGVADRAALLASEGYRPLGVTSLVLPGGERFGWILAADDAESYVILAGGSSRVGLTGIYSAWADGTWLATQHPMGEAFDRNGLHTQIVRTTLADAVRVHRATLDRLRAIHDSPRSIRTMGDMLALDEDYRVRFGGSRLRPVTARIVLPAMLSACAFLVSVILLVTWR